MAPRNPLSAHVPSIVHMLAGTHDRSTIRMHASAPDRLLVRARIPSAAFASILCLIALVLSTLALPHSALAMPAFPGLQTVSQPDGSEVSYYIHGDESFAYFTDENGSLLQRDPQTGALCYVVDSGDGTLSLGEQAGNATAQADGTPSSANNARQSEHVSAADGLFSVEARETYATLAGKTAPSRMTHDFPLLSCNAAGTLSFGQNTVALPDSIPLLTIVVGFSDMPYRDNYDWSSQIFTGEYSTAAFWSDASNGSFTFEPAPESSAYGISENTNQCDAENDGVVHVTLDEDHGNWGGNQSDPMLLDFVNMLQRAFSAAEESVDFASFDSNNDGILTTDELAVNFVIAGYESSYSGEDYHSFWAHAWNTQDIGEWLVADGMKASNYIAMGEVQGFASDPTKPEAQNSASTVTHELGHYLGLPDLYNTTGEKGAWSDYVVHGLSVMASGAWGSDIPITRENIDKVTEIPTRLDPLCSYLLGFSTPIEITEEGAYTAQASKSESGYRFYSIQIPGTDEYYFIENRLTQGFDKGLCGIYSKTGDGTDVAGGLVVWHLDASTWDARLENNTVNTPDHQPAYMPVYLESYDASGERSVMTRDPFRTTELYNELQRDGTAFTDTLQCFRGTVDDPNERTASGIGVFALGEAQDAADFKMVFADIPDDADAADAATILFTNDVHGAGLDPASEGLTYASVAALKLEARTLAGTSNATLIDAGDAVQGNALATLSKGSIPVDAMGSADYDIAVPGNHEFDYGVGTLKKLEDQAADWGIAYLTANADDLTLEDQGPFSRPLFDRPGVAMHRYIVGGKPVTVAFIGIATPETLTKSRPSNFQDEEGNTIVGFCEDETGQALYERVQQSVDAARQSGADYVIAVGHLGNRGVTPRWSSKEVIANTSGIDALIDGHSHEQENEYVVDAQGNDVLLVQTGTQLSSIGKITLRDGGFDVEFVTSADYAKKDADVTAALERYQDEFAEILNEEVAKSQVAMPWETEEGLRLATVGETNLGDLVADAYRSAMGADIGLMNAGGLRAPIEAGTLTYGDILSVQPFGNTIVMAQVTGQQLLDALEMGARLYPESCNGLLQVSGMAYQIDPSVPSGVVTDASGAFVRVDGERRVKNVTVGEAPIDPNATYTVASHNFMLVEGGDGMSMFKSCPIITDEGTTDVQTLIDYIQRDLGGEIGEGYLNQNGAGRITIAQASEPDDGNEDDSSDAGDDSAPGGAGDASNADGESGGTGSDSHVEGDANNGLAATGDSPALEVACLASAAAFLAVIVIAARRATLPRRR